jgi:hypothetical protein
MTQIIDAPPLKELLASQPLMDRLLQDIEAENICLVREVISRQEVRALVDYLTGIGRGSLPNWQPIMPKCPNHHRVNQWDPRSYVKACFHQFSFFPWNHDVFNLFQRLGDVFALRNRLAGAEPDAYMGQEPFDDCIARLSFQFYPRGAGAMNAHIDPAGPHQAVVPTLMMSELGSDFREGGAFVKNSAQETIWIERHTNPGDLVLFSPKLVHGVGTIDPGTPVDWPSFQGRWMSIFAVNKLATNMRVGEAVDMGRPEP